MDIEHCTKSQLVHGTIMAHISPTSGRKLRFQHAEMNGVCFVYSKQSTEANVSQMEYKPTSSSDAILDVLELYLIEMAAFVSVLCC